MTEQPALVVAVDEQGISVSIQTCIIACTFCAGGCVFSRLAGLGKTRADPIYIKKDRITADCNQVLRNVRPGDRIILGIRENQLLAASIIVYFIPLLLFLTAMQTANIAFDNELITIMAGGAGLLTGFLGLQRLERSGYSRSWWVTLRRSHHNS